MTNERQQEHRGTRAADSTSKRAWPRWLSMLLGVGILLGAGGISLFWLTHQPRARPEPPTPQLPVVEVVPVRLGTHRVIVDGLGTVMPAREVALSSQVSGEVLKVSPKLVPGGRFAKGETILRIDPIDYRLRVRQLQSNVASARYEFQVEQGRQKIARREYALLGEELGEALSETDRQLVLRAPQAAAAQANLGAAEASLEQARLELARTRITAPFNGTVQAQQVSRGSQVRVGSPLLTLVDTDAYWVEVLLPVHRLRWVRIADLHAESATARIFHEAAWGRDTYRKGTVRHLRADLEPQGRMARLVVSVPDPLTLRSENAHLPRLLLGAVVRVAIQGENHGNVLRLPRALLREGGQVWLLSPANTLEIRSANILWNTEDAVFIGKGFSEGERIVISDISAPVRGMRLQPAPASPSPERGRGT